MQRPYHRQQVHVALGRKMILHKNKNSNVKFSKSEESKRWKVMFNQEVWNENGNGIKQAVGTDDAHSSLAKLNAAIHCPSARSHDQFHLLHGKSNERLCAGSQCQSSDAVIARGLSAFTGSARFKSSRLKSGQTFEVGICPLQESCEVCLRIMNQKESLLERKPNSAFPDATDILLERADTWRGNLPPVKMDKSLTKAPKAFQPKNWQSFRPEFTQPYKFTYFTDK